MIQESAYVDVVKSCAKFNRTMSMERYQRTPFLDPQTGIAQRAGHQWRRAEERGPGRRPDEVLSYPPRRYRRRPRPANPLRPEIQLFGPLPMPPPGMHMNDNSQSSFGGEPEASRGSESTQAAFFHPTREATKMPVVESAYLDDEDDDLDDPEDTSDGDDYSDTYKKGKSSSKTPVSKGRGLESSKKTPTGAPYTVGKDGKKRYFGGAAAALIPPEEKPYICPRKNCDARYKSKPGLNYHLAHVHSDFNGIQKPGSSVSVSETTHPTPNTTITTAPMATAPPTPSKAPTPSNSEGAHPPNDYCDFCLGTGEENKKTGQAEELTSCHDCGRSGHPTCLKFTANMIVSTKKYGWQCIECKSCAICGTSENDECLLFCDDCDRGFHLYCLTPRLAAPPEGEWSCHLCQCIECKSCAICGTSENDECLLFCDDCDRGFHLYCLTPRLAAPPEGEWSCHLCQCIECKSCAICGTSENDECLLFCDDCDRGFHLYCLTPRLAAPPEGEWSCHLCQVEFGAKASRPLLHKGGIPPTLPPPPMPTLPLAPLPMPK